MVHKGLILFIYLAVITCVSAEVKGPLKHPDWHLLEPFQGSLTRNEFEHTLRSVYCPRVSWYQDWIKILDEKFLVRKKTGKNEWYSLSFRDSNQTTLVSRQEFFLDANHSLNGIRIALDPGHIGGEYAEMEGRNFSIDGKPSVKEGDLSLMVAKSLKKKLDSLGADVILVRKKNFPVTSLRPNDFTQDAEKWTRQREQNMKNKFSEKERTKVVQKKKEVLFYRLSEIHARAEMINKVIRPDFVICIHLNAAPWPDPENFSLVERNDYHVLVNGCYMGGELADDNQRFDMLFRLFNGWHETELRLADHVSLSFEKLTKLPPFSYKGPNALKIGTTKGVWGRNLLANRIYLCPVLFLEPYVANSKDVFNRIQLGIYSGKKKIKGEWKLNLVEEYSESVFRGIKNSFDPNK